jgi:hypothetical protein
MQDGCVPSFVVYETKKYNKMNEQGERKLNIIPEKIKKLFESILMDESFLNYPMERVTKRIYTFLEKLWEKVLKNILMDESVLNYPVEKMIYKMGGCLDKLVIKTKEIEWKANIQSVSSKIPRKIAFLSVSSATVIIWMVVSGVVEYNAPKNVSFFVQNAHGADKLIVADHDVAVPISGKNPIFDLTTSSKENDISDAKCSDDRKKGKSSELCANIEEEQNLINEMSLENKRVEDKKMAEINKKKRVSRPFSRGISCAEKNDHPGYSDTKGKHKDEDCCPDPDEWPKPGCAYSAAGLALMLKGPK